MTDFADWARLTVIALTVIVGVLSALTLGNYASKMGRSLPDRRRGQHIFKVAASHLLLLVFASADSISRLGDPAHWALPFKLSAAILTLSALIDLRHYQRSHP